MSFEEYKEIVGGAAAIVTIAQFFAPVFIMKKMIDQKTTKNVDPTPFIGGLGMSVIMLQHGLILKDMAMIPVNIFAFILNIVYVGIFYKYHKKKGEVQMMLGKVLAGACILVGYAQVEQKNNLERLEFWYGTTVTVLILVLIGAPLFNLKEIVASKNTEKLPFPMILSGTVVTFLWLLYGIILQNVFIQIQNFVGFFLCCIQLSLFVIYPSKSSINKSKKQK